MEEDKEDEKKKKKLIPAAPVELLDLPPAGGEVGAPKALVPAGPRLAVPDEGSVGRRVAVSDLFCCFVLDWSGKKMKKEEEKKVSLFVFPSVQKKEEGKFSKIKNSTPPPLFSPATPPGAAPGPPPAPRPPAPPPPRKPPSPEARRSRGTPCWTSSLSWRPCPSRGASWGGCRRWRSASALAPSRARRGQGSIPRWRRA